MLKDLYATKAEAAEILGVNPLTIYRWVKQGRLEGEKIGREVLILRIDIEALRAKPTLGATWPP